MNLGEFDGKTVLVTGAAQGIGSVVAKMFLERGATVIAVDQNEEGLNELLNEIHLKTFCLDVSDSTAVEQMVNDIENEIAPIDILVNVAGVLRMGAIHSLSDEDWNKTFSVNSTGVFYMSRAVSKHMMQKKVRGNCYSWFKCSKYAENGDGCICCIKSCYDDVYEMFRIRTCSVQHSL